MFILYLKYVVLLLLAAMYVQLAYVVRNRVGARSPQYHAPKPVLFNYALLFDSMQVSVKHLLSEFGKNPLNCELTRCIVRLLAASHQFPRELLLDAMSINLLRDFCLHTLKNGSISGSPLAIQNSLDCCTLVSYNRHQKFPVVP